MDTREARTELRDLTVDALDIVDRIAAGNRPAREERTQLRHYASEARSLVADAGYPGEAAWRALQRASMGVDTLGDDLERPFWSDVAADLRRARETLSSLVGSSAREADIHIIG